MIAPFVETNFFIQRAQFAIDASANKTVARQLCQLFFEFAFSTAHDRRQNHDALAFRQGTYVLQDLIDTLARDRCAASRTMRNTNG